MGKAFLLERVVWRALVEEVLFKLRSETSVLTEISQPRVRLWIWQKALHPGQGEAYAKNLQS